MSTAGRLTANRKDAHLGTCLKDDVEYGSRDGNGFAAYRVSRLAARPRQTRRLARDDVPGEAPRGPSGDRCDDGGHAARGGGESATCDRGHAMRHWPRPRLQRRMLEERATGASYAVREHAPDLPLVIGNLGAVQLNYGVDLAELEFVIRGASCDAMNLHLNPLQEAVQPERATNFSGLLAKIASLPPRMSVPVLVKEVGAGISETIARKLAELPIAGVETAGGGGTSSSKVESRRAAEWRAERSTGELFARWRVPTAESLLAWGCVLPKAMAVVASGGIRNGSAAAKALALGADVVAFALPMLKAVETSIEAGMEAIGRVKDELRTAMFLAGSRNVEELRQRSLRRSYDFTSEGPRA
jgi:isopentenyl-diphosphate delta-isomerase